jgi:hypothetical protein
MSRTSGTVPSLVGADGFSTTKLLSTPGSNRPGTKRVSLPGCGPVYSIPTDTPTPGVPTPVCAVPKDAQWHAALVACGLVIIAHVTQEATSTLRQHCAFILPGSAGFLPAPAVPTSSPPESLTAIHHAEGTDMRPAQFRGIGRRCQCGGVLCAKRLAWDNRSCTVAAISIPGLCHRRARHRMVGVTAGVMGNIDKPCPGHTWDTRRARFAIEPGRALC